ncbi:MAG TPA: GDSL-type esterase/lipase family protein [Vicinamibacterales bacterium]|nr:GDSL-type esterase/lipase family protein [Vicinamibacterales bacterium]
MQTGVVIVALGDSTTAGTPLYLSPLEAPPDGRGDERSQYAYWLRQRHPGWRVLNRGVNGERSDQIAVRFDRDVIGEQPAAVIVIAGVNDIYQGRAATLVMAELAGIYRRAAAARIPVVAGSIVPYNTATPAQNAAMHAVNAWIAGEATGQEHVAFADTRRAAAAADDPDRLAGSPDGLHPDVEGYRRMADAIDPVLVAVLARSYRTPLQP